MKLDHFLEQDGVRMGENDFVKECMREGVSGENTREVDQ